MSRRHDYDEQEGCDRRIPSDRRNPGESRYLDDPRYGTDRREQPIIRDLRDRRFPLERRDYADSREQEEGGEIRIARGVRESRYPGYRRETLTPRDTRSLDDTGPTERIYQRRAPRELVASEDPRHAREYHRNAGGVRYSQDPRRIRDETNDPRLLRRRRENSDDTRIPYEREYQRTDQPTSRSNFIEQSQSQWDNVRDSSRSDVDIRGQEYFLPAAGISRAVIEADLRLYLGPNATCRPVTNREVRINHVR